MPPSTQRSNQAPIRVIRLGLNRTGTSSMTDALDILGFGPCYHTLRLLNAGGNDFEKWAEQYEKRGDPEVIDQILQGYDLMVLSHFQQFQTTRDPEKWERSMKRTIQPATERAFTASDDLLPMQKSYAIWQKINIKVNPELLTDNFQDVLLRHTERVKKAILASQLLVYRVEEGWEPLTVFLGVPIPDEPFPNVNDTEKFRVNRKLPPLQ
ncbi:hypothetical protein M422DRAFT_264360 [Sphaerobolus stellatus SS14]|uniref:Sulfotransferase family protein n=1 Tax=Sphaerobolus stellatus (strain SS14) TaxID=990650 RepID=A0A0C9TTH0_SPHS4|nr:hypothetical protein M422DRAFT_264360 [Sphaerobolus stellatus SS14]